LQLAGRVHGQPPLFFSFTIWYQPLAVADGSSARLSVPCGKDVASG
jgi:hypothetical protein